MGRRSPPTACFFGCEDPHARNQVLAPRSRTRQTLGSTAGCCARAPLAKGSSFTQSFVIGVAPAGQLRRAFLYYLERERAHPYRPFLHYNSWYDIAWAPYTMNEANCLEAIRAFGEQLDPAARRDAGRAWSSTTAGTTRRRCGSSTADFPTASPRTPNCAGSTARTWASGFRPSAATASRASERLKYGREQGYEINADRLLAGRAEVLRRLQGGLREHDPQVRREPLQVRRHRRRHVCQRAARNYVLDTEAMRRLMLELRQEDPHAVHQPHHRLVAVAVLAALRRFGLAAGRRHGLGGQGPAAAAVADLSRPGDLPQHRRQRPAVSAQRADDPGRRLLAARHGRRSDVQLGRLQGRRARVFRQPAPACRSCTSSPASSRPRTGECWPRRRNGRGPTPTCWSTRTGSAAIRRSWKCYGYASWTPRKGIVMLRNPDDQPHEFALDVGAALELPPGGATRYQLKSPWAEDAQKPAICAAAGQPVRIELQPFQVLVLEATPEGMR